MNKKIAFLICLGFFYTYGNAQLNLIGSAQNGATNAANGDANHVGSSVVNNTFGSIFGSKKKTKKDTVRSTNQPSNISGSSTTPSSVSSASTGSGSSAIPASPKISVHGNFEGVVTYSVTADNPRARQLNHKQNNTIFYIKGNKIKIVTGNSTMTNTIIMDQENPDNSINLMNINGKKYQLLTDSTAKLPDPEIKYTSETKMIAGYTCYKAEVTLFLNKEKTNSIREDVYYTTEISDNFYGTVCKGLKGFPLEWITKRPADNPNVITTHFLAVTVDKQTVPDEEFNVPAGYKQVRQEELSQEILKNGK